MESVITGETPLSTNSHPTSKNNKKFSQHPQFIGFLIDAPSLICVRKPSKSIQYLSSKDAGTFLRHV
ncbi:MAG: hypothetical protein K2M56_07665 [Muribaculaceae bacterium]|nr:hypothetical protein [Muribaculaceae bacterium]